MALVFSLWGGNTVLAQVEQVVKEKWSDFRFDQPLNESLFSLEAPKGFAVETRKAKGKDAIAEDEAARAAKIKEMNK